jgi:drug/metabolite transporter (DMT)-like permease
MGSIAFALSSALFYGVADFLGGLGSRRAAALPVAALSQVAGWATLVLIVLLLPSPGPTPTSLMWGIAGGVSSAAFLSLFYYLLSVGRMGIVAPVSAVWAVIVPVAAGILFGERPGPPVMAGIVLAMGATVMMSGGDSGKVTASSPPIGRLVLLSVLAGILGGLYFISLERAGDDAGYWPLFLARLTSSVITVAALWLTRLRSTGAERRPISRAVLWPALGSGVLDSTGSTFYVIAVREQLLSVVATLVSLYTGFTVLLAWIVLREKLRPRHLIGLVLAGGAIALIVSS